MRRRSTSRAVLLVALITGVMLGPLSCPVIEALAAAPSPNVPVLKVIDGNTIDVQLEGQRIRVRYIGVNTPETKHPTKGKQPCGPEAKDANRTLVEGQTVRLEFDAQRWDRYQRLLAYVYVGDIMVNAELVRQGYAQAATYPPNVKYAEQFRALQQEAREANLGCWKAR